MYEQLTNMNYIYGDYLILIKLIIIKKKGYYKIKHSQCFEYKIIQLFLDFVQTRAVN